MPLNFAESESRRFSLAIYRAGKTAAGDLPSFFHECAEKRPDVIILRMKSDEASALLPALAGKCHVITADSLLEFRKPLNRHNVADDLNSGAAIEEITADNRHLMENLVERCYFQYTSHYHANPCVEAGSVLPGFVEFSHSFIGKDNRTVLVAVYKGRSCGYLCLEIKDGAGSTVIGGSALDLPPGMRHKILCDLTHRGDEWLLSRSVKMFTAITRTDNLYIQKLLIKNMHCLPVKSVVTLHINLFLSAMRKTRPEQVPHAHSDRTSLTAYEMRSGGTTVFSESCKLTRDNWQYAYYADSDEDGICRIASVISPNGTV